MSKPQGLWNETINPETGQSSLAEHHLKVVFKGCKVGTCHYIETEDPRQVKCQNCGQHKDFIIGYHQLVSGQLVNCTP